MIYENGDIFEGSFINGIREGKGKKLNKNGSSYEGDYKNDLPNGFGTYIFSNQE